MIHIAVNMYNNIIYCVIYMFIYVRHDVGDCEHSAATAVQAEYGQQATVLAQRYVYKCIHTLRTNCI